MSLRIVLSVRAERETLTTARWYARRSPGLDDRFRQALKACFNSIVGHPVAFPKVKGRIRQARLKVFPFTVVYKVIDDELFIISVFHVHRDPTTKLPSRKQKRE